MNGTFYYFPFACSTASHILLEESGLGYQRQLVDLTGGKHRRTDYLVINQKGTVPALLLPSGLLTENQAILTFIADQVPQKTLIPPAGSIDRAIAHEWMNYCAASIHPYVRMVFRPAAYVGDAIDAQRAVSAQGQRLMNNVCRLVEQKLKPQRWSTGERFSVSDAYLFILYLWTRDPRMIDMPICPKWQALARRVSKRTSTEKVLQRELADRPDYRLPTL